MVLVLQHPPFAYVAHCLEVSDMKKFVLVTGVCLILLFVFLSPDSGQPSQNTSDIVMQKLTELYGVDFIYVNSSTAQDGGVEYQCHPCDKDELVVTASFQYAHDPLYIFPFSKRVVFIDDMVECIRNYCVLNTWDSYDVYLSENEYDIDKLTGQILSCLSEIEYMFEHYDIDKDLNVIYVPINLIYKNRTVHAEFSDFNSNQIKSKIIDAIQE